MSSERIQRLSLALIALFMLPTAIQATFAPASWFDDFPLGRGWVAAEGGVYDEHLVRDVGVLFLALIVATAWSVPSSPSRFSLRSRRGPGYEHRRRSEGSDVDEP